MNQQSIQQGAPEGMPPAGGMPPASPMPGAGMEGGMPPVPPSPMSDAGLGEAPLTVPDMGGGLPGGAPEGAPEGEIYVGEEQKQELVALIDSIRERLGQLSSGRFMSENANDEVRKGALKEVFAILQSAGVDLSDPASVVDFIETIREQNPEIANDFEDAMEMLLDGYMPKDVDVDVSDLLGTQAPAGDPNMAPEMGGGAPPMGEGLPPTAPGSLSNETQNETEALPQNMGGPAPQDPLGEVG